MKKYISIIGVVVICLICLLFFYNTILFGKLPVPIDSLVGLYHPWRDFYALTYPRGMPFKNFLITDPVREQIPWRKLAIDEWKKGNIPSWNPTSFSGTPLGANIQSAAFYPLNIIFLLLPFTVAWSVLIILQPMLGGLWMYMYLRNRGVSVCASVFGSFLFAFSGASISWMTWGTIGHVVLWIPLLLLVIDKLEVKKTGILKTILWCLLGAFITVMIMTAGHTQAAFYALLVCVAYSVGHYVIAPKSRLYALWRAGLSLITGVLLVSPLLLALFNFTSTTNRLVIGGAWATEGFFIPATQLVQFIAPDFFGNPATLNYWGVWNYGEMIGYVSILGLLFAFIAVWIGFRRKYILFWLSVLVVSLVDATKNPVSAIPYLSHTPLISSMQPTRLLIIVDLVLAILAAHGLDIWLSKKKQYIHALPSVVLGLIIVGLWVYIRYLPQAPMEVAKRNMVLPTVFFLCYVAGLSLYLWVLKNKRLNKMGSVGILLLLGGILIFDVFRFGWKYTPFVDGQYFFPETQALSFLQTKEKPFRIMSIDDRALPPDTYAFYNLESVGGYDPLKSERYERLIAAIEQGKSDVRYPYGFERIMTPKNYQSPLFSLLHVRYVVSMSQIHDVVLREVFREGETHIYEYTKFLPYVYLPQSVSYLGQPDVVLSTMFSSTFNPWLDAIVEKNLSLVDAPLANNETIRIISYSANEIQVQLMTQSDRLLATGIIYANGWHAYVDDKEVPLYRTNYVFIGVVAPGGTHVVRFTHRLL
jgi:Bacterial membrane protein YfhO